MESLDHSDHALLGLAPEVPPALPMRRFTVEEYHRLIREGFFDEDRRFELLEGWIVYKMGRNPPHDVSLDLCQDAFRAILPPGWRLRGQSAVTTAESEPEPDYAIVPGSARDYLQRHPGPEDAAVVVEISDSTLADDRSMKKRIYARAGVRVYWIVNVVDRQIEVYTGPTGPCESPTYRSRRDYKEGEAVPLVLDGREVGVVHVSDVLP